MAYTQQQLATLSSTFDALPQNVKDMFNAASTSDTAEAIANIVATRRQQGMAEALASNVSVSVADMDALQAIAQVADGATLRPALVAFKQALMVDESVAAMSQHGFAALFAALKHFNI